MLRIIGGGINLALPLGELSAKQTERVLLYWSDA